MAEPTLEHYQKYLAIDPDDLDQCLVEQPEIYYHVDEAYENAIAARDSAKRLLEEATAELDQDVRKKAAEDEEKITEGSVEKRVRILPKYKRLNGEYLYAKAEAGKWGALKESFQQRSFMLRELVMWKLKHMADMNIEQTATRGRDHLAQDNRQRAGQMRRYKRQQRD